jgi:hypothetical protein
MTRTVRVKPNSQAIRAFGYPTDQVTAYEVISVTRYASGTRRASHARLDTTSNRMVFTQLSVPTYDWNCAHGMAHDLAEAGREHLEEAHLQEPLF